MRPEPSTSSAFYDHYLAMLDSGSVDAVVIWVPSYLHPPMGIDALQHGVHVLLEKPSGSYWTGHDVPSDFNDDDYLAELNSRIQDEGLCQPRGGPGPCGGLGRKGKLTSWTPHLSHKADLARPPSW
jgi:hypothetical protein